MTVVRLKINPETAKIIQLVPWNVINCNSIDPLLVSNMQKELVQSNLKVFVK